MSPLEDAHDYYGGLLFAPVALGLMVVAAVTAYALTDSALEEKVDVERPTLSGNGAGGW